MIHRTPEEQARFIMLKQARAILRLKHSTAAENELNDVLPVLEKKFNKLLLQGKPPAQVDLKALLYENPRDPA